MTQRATGPFEVKMAPQEAADEAAGSTLGRMLNEKVFSGDLVATSRGQMLTAGSDTEQGSAAYVLLERVTGMLGGKSGSFVLHHSATLDRGAPAQSVTVVPDTGSGELVGLAGRLTIRVEAGGKHFYDFDYTLP